MSSKKSTRKSPGQSATLYKPGTKKTGIDGNKWVISETTNGIKRWKLYRNITKKPTKKVAKKVTKKGIVNQSNAKSALIYTKPGIFHTS
jgi:hypothetical protein